MGKEGLGYKDLSTTEDSESETMQTTKAYLSFEDLADELMDARNHILDLVAALKYATQGHELNTAWRGDAQKFIDAALEFDTKHTPKKPARLRKPGKYA